MIVPVILRHEGNPGIEVKVYALLDDASDTTFTKSSVKETLGVQGVDTAFILNTMIGREEIQVSRVDGLVVECFDRKVQVQLPRAYTRDLIPSRRDQIPRPEVAEAWLHLRKIKDQIIPYQSDLEIGLLIGCNCPKAIKPKEVIRGNASDPYGLHTILGWGIIGPVDQPQDVNSPDHKSNVSFCNRIVNHEVGSSKINHFNFVVNPQTREKICPVMVNRFFQQDFSEQSSNHRVLSSEDRRFPAIAEKGIRHLENGHYELPLPLKNSSVTLPNNRELALQRLSHLKKRFMTIKQYRKDYVEFMENVITRGYAERVPQHANGGQISLLNSHSSTQQVWYIPYHGVYHPKKPGKIRVIFDCAAQFRDDSLNKNLLQGPDLTNTLTGVLCCFRQEPVGFICNTESMFYQVYMKEEHRDFLHFLWWEDGNTAKDPVEYRMTVHLFGATSSPGCANFALKCTAKDHESELGADAANFL